MNKCRFLNISSVIRRKFSTFALANSRQTTFKEAGAAIGREHYILECVADALFLAVLKLPQSNLVVKDIAEVDAAGRYIPFPLVCRWLTMPSCTPLGAYYIYQRRGYHSVRSLLRAVEGLKRRTGRSQIPRFSFVADHQNMN